MIRGLFVGGAIVALAFGALELALFLGGSAIVVEIAERDARRDREDARRRNLR